MTRIIRLVLAVAVLVPALAACGSPNQDLDEVRAAMARTELLARRFVYTEETLDTAVAVEGLVEDDFRYKAQLTLDGKPAYVEAVQDDAIAARILSTDGGQIYGDLGTFDWVLDPIGAPDLASVVTREPGVDPVLDSLDVFRYINDVMLRENVIVRFEEEDFEYRAVEDPFDQPEKGSGVVRYDVRPFRLPKASDAANGNQVAPDARFFRKAAIYIKDGLVVRVQEDIDVAGKLDEIEKNYDIEFPEGASTDDKVRISVTAINAVRRGQGLLPIRPRVMSLDLLDLGKRIDVEMPPGVKEGDVSALRARGTDDLRPKAAQS